MSLRWMVGQQRRIREISIEKENYKKYVKSQKNGSAYDWLLGK